MTMCERLNRLLLQCGDISSTLGFFAIYFNILLSQSLLFSPLVHVVGPLWAAASFAVDEAPSASWKGTAASSAVVCPGFLTISIIVLEENQQTFRKQLKPLYHTLQSCGNNGCRVNVHESINNKLKLFFYGGMI